MPPSVARQPVRIARTRPPPPILSKTFFRTLFWVAMAVYFAIAVTLLVLRYGVLPRVDSWRPQIEQAASQALGGEVRIGRVEADWRGLNPRLAFHDVRVHDTGGASPVLDIPSATGVLSWRSVLQLTPRFLSLQIDGVALRLRRDAENRLWAAGRSFSLEGGGEGMSLDDPALKWIAAQKEVVLRGATLVWQDDLRAAPPLTLAQVHLRLRNGPFSHALVLNAAPPPALARGISVRAAIDRSFFSLATLGDLRDTARQWRGQVYAELEDAEPVAWRPWADVPTGAHGRAAFRAWGQLQEGKLAQVTLDLALRDLRMESDELDIGLRMGAFQARLEGAPGDVLAGALEPEMLRTHERDGLALQFTARDMSLRAGAVFDPGLPDLREVSADLSLNRPDDGPLVLRVRQALIENDDLRATLQGEWRDEGSSSAGTADLSGQLERVSLPMLWRYLPSEVSGDARQWLSQGLVAGQVSGAAFTVRGDLAQFPFDGEGDPGNFRVAGSVAGAIVDYAPPRPTRKGWPRLEGLSGTFEMLRDTLSLRTQGGLVRVTPRHAVALETVEAVIPNMNRQGVHVKVEGTSQGDAAAYLALSGASPLGTLLDGLLDDTRATGQWQVPIKLDIPLLDVDDTTVAGSILFDGGEVRQWADIPPLRQVRGRLGFTEKGMSAHDITGQFLGGGFRLNGELASDKPGLAFTGTASAAGIQQLSPSAGLKRLSGQTPYTGKLVMNAAKQVDVYVASDLRGLALDFPAPFGKAAVAPLPLQAEWTAAQDAGPDNRRWLTVTAGENINMLFERHMGQQGGAYFRRGALGVERAASLPEAGMSVSARVPVFDVGAWQVVDEEFSGNGAVAPGVVSGAAASAGAKPGATKPAQAAASRDETLFPGVQRISLQAGKLQMGGHTFDDANLYATRPAADQWRVELASRQAEGAVSWREASGAIAGQVTARFKRLALGEAPEPGAHDKPAPKPEGDEEPNFSEDALSDLPGVDLRVDSLALYGRELGELDLEGTNQERGRRWQLDRLTLKTPEGTLSATGTWRTSGLDRGLTTDARLEVSDLGKLLGRLGFPDRVSGGHGEIKGKLAWRNLPWRHDYADLTGTLDASLDNGRFVHLKSRSARLLELLSLQSAQRLARLDLNPVSALREGFPFDTLRTQQRFANGRVSTEGFKVTGPAATIVLAGSTDLINEQLDLHAVVIPNLDASGAAIAAGIAVNPIIGIGAFLTQWLLKAPLARAMTAEYSVQGNWEDPKVEPIDTSATGLKVERSTDRLPEPVGN